MKSGDKRLQWNAGDVLAVDDYLEFLHTLRLNFKDRHLELRTASSGEEALEEMKRHPAKVLLLDIVMPQMDGIEVARLVRLRWPQTYIIFLTSHDETEMRERAIPVGDGFVSKGYDIGLIPYRVQEALHFVAAKTVLTMRVSHRLGNEMLNRTEMLRECLDQLRVADGTEEREEIIDKAEAINDRIYRFLVGEALASEYDPILSGARSDTGSGSSSIRVDDLIQLANKRLQWRGSALPISAQPTLKSGQELRIYTDRDIMADALGEIFLALRMCEGRTVAVVEKDDSILFSFSGLPEIPEVKLAELFEPFTTVHPVIECGNGGLPLARHIVEWLRGTLKAIPSEVGSILELSLPIARTSRESQP